jgi:translation elongation factor P/translation initiation factor 5A
VEAGQLRKGDFFDFKGKRCVVLKTSQQINNRKAFAIVEFRDVETGAKHRETLQAGDKFEKHWVSAVTVNFLYADESTQTVHFQNPENFEQLDVPLALVGRSMLEYLGDGQEAVVLCNDAGALSLSTPYILLAHTSRDLLRSLVIPQRSPQLA